MQIAGANQEIPEEQFKIVIGQSLLKLNDLANRKYSSLISKICV